MRYIEHWRTDGAKAETVGQDKKFPERSQFSWLPGWLAVERDDYAKSGNS
jgi:hypothetical protein